MLIKHFYFKTSISKHIEIMLTTTIKVIRTLFKQSQLRNQIRKVLTPPSSCSAYYTATELSAFPSIKALMNKIALQPNFKNIFLMNDCYRIPAPGPRLLYTIAGIRDEVLPTIMTHSRNYHLVNIPPYFLRMYAAAILIPGLVPIITILPSRR